MSSVDNRIVQMKFNNSQFEAGAAKTMQTLSKLKNSLKFSGAAKGLEKVEASADKVSFSGMSKALDTISKRFSTFGVISAAALQKLTYTAIDTGAKIANAITNPLVEGGKRRALNIEQAKFQFEGLGIDVEAAMASALEAVSGTAYGLDAAAKVASQFGASGMKAGADMTQSLRAVSGVAAMTGSEYEDIGQIFVAVAGQGRLMGDQLLQLSGRGINAASTLAKALGKTEGEVREMVSDGEISFEVFYKAMDEAFGEHAKDANKTFTGAFANMKAALSRIGADVATPAFRSLRNIYNALTPVIDNFHKALNPLIGAITKTIKHAEKMTKTFLGGIKQKDLNNIGKGLSSLFKSARNVFRGITSIVKPLKEGLREALPPNLTKGFKQLAVTLRKVTSSFQISAGAAEGFKNIGRSVGNIVSSMVNVIKAAISVLKPIKEAFVEVFAPIKDSLSNLMPPSFTKALVDITGKLKDFTAGLIVSGKGANTVKTFFKGLFTIIANIIKPIGSLAGIVKKILSPVFKLFGVTVKAVGSILQSTVKVFVNLVSAGINPLSKAIQFVAPKLGNLVKKFLDGVQKSKLFNDILSKVNNVVKNVTNTFSGSTTKLEGFTNVLKLLGNSWLRGIGIIKEGLSTAITILSNDILPNAVNTISTTASEIKEKLFTILAFLSEDFIPNLGKYISNGFEVLKATLIDILTFISNDIIGKIPESIQQITPWFVKLAQSITSLITETFMATLKGAGQFVTRFIDTFTEFSVSLIASLTNLIKGIGGAVKESLSEAINEVVIFSKRMIESFDELGPRIKESVSSSLSTIRLVINDTLEVVINSIGEFIDRTKASIKRLTNVLVDGIITGIHFMGEEISLILDGVVDIFEAFVEECVRIANDFGQRIAKSVTSGFIKLSDETTERLNKVIRVVKTFGAIVGGILAVAVKTISDKVNLVKDAMGKMGLSLNNSALQNVQSVLDKLKEKFSILGIPAKKAAEAMDKAFSNISERAQMSINTFKKFYNMVKNVFNKIADFFRPATEQIAKLFEGLSFVDIFNTVSLMGIVQVFKKLSGSLGGIGKSFEGLLGSASKTLDSVRKSLETYQKTVKAKVIKDIAISIGILAASIIALSFVKPEEMASGLIGVTTLLTEIIASLAILNKMDVDGKNVNKAALAMDLIAVSISILAGALKKLQGFATIGDIVPALIGVSLLIIEMTTAMTILIKSLDKADSDTIGTDMLKASISMIAMASAIKKLASAVQKLGSLPLDQLLQGAGAVGALLTALVAFAALTKGRELDNVAAVILSVSVSMLLLQKAIQKFSEMDLKSMYTGLVRVAEVMGLFVIAIKLMSGSAIVGAASTITAMAVALRLLIKPIQLFGTMDFGTLAKGLGGVAIAMAEMVAAVNFIPKDGTKGAGAMIAMATALTILAVPIKLLGSMDLMSLVMGLGAVAVVLGGLTGIMVVLAPLGTSLITVAGAFALFGGAMTLVGVGVLAFATGLTTLAASATLSVGALMVFLGTLPMIVQQINNVLSTIAQLAPSLAASIQIIGDQLVHTMTHLLQTVMADTINVLTEIIKVIASRSPEFVQAGVEIINNLLIGLQQVVPQIKNLAVTIISELINGIRQLVPQIVSLGVTIIKNLLSGIRKVAKDVKETAVTLVKEFLDGVRKVFPDMINTGVDMIKSLLKGLKKVIPDVLDTAVEIVKKLLTTIRDNIGDLVEIGVDAILNFVKGITKSIGKIVDAAIKAAISFINGLADGIRDNGDALIDAVGNLFDSLIDFLIKVIKDGIPKILKKGWELAKALVDGIAEWLPKLPEKALELVKALVNGIRDAIPRIIDVAGDIIQGFIDGLKNGISSIIETGKEIAGGILDSVKDFLGIHSPSREFIKLGEMTVLGYKEGLKKESKDMYSYAEFITGPFTKAVSNTIKEMKFGQGVVKAFYKNFVKGTKDMIAGNMAIYNMGKAVRSFAEELYVKSDLYKEDTKRQREYEKEYEKLQKKLGKLKEKEAKAEKKAAKSSKKASETKIKAKKAEAKASEDSSKKTKKANDDIKKSNDELSKSADNAAKSMRGLRQASAEKPATTPEEPKVLTAKEQFAKDKAGGFGSDDKEKKKKSSKTKSEARKASTQAKRDKNDLKKVQKDIEQAEKELKNLEKKMGKEGQKVAKNIQKVFNELRNSIAESVKDFVSPLSVDLDSGIDIFSEFNREYELTSAQLLDNMKSQNEGVRKWNEDLKNLVKRGLDEGLIKTLKEMGPQGAEQVAAFMKMTDDEIKEANKQWQLSNELTAQTVLKNQKEALKNAKEWADGITKLAKMGLNKKLLKELGDAGVGSSEYVKAYLSMTPSQIKELNKTYKKTLSIPNEVADSVIASYIAAGDKSLTAFGDGASGKKNGKRNKISKQVHEAAFDLVKDIGSKASRLSELNGRDIVKSMAEGIKNSVPLTNDAIEEASKSLMDTLKENANSDEAAKIMYEFGTAISDSLKSSLDPMQISMESGIDIFSEFNREFKLTSKELLANMESQNIGIRQWNNSLSELVRRGLDEGLIQKLREMGPQSAEQVAAFLKMTNEEIEKANAEWRKSNELTAETIIKNQKEALKTAEEWAAGITELAKKGLNKDLLKQLGEAGVGSSEYVKAYLSMSSKQIAEVNDYYEKQLSIPDQIANSIVSSFIDAGEKSLKGFTDGATGKGDYSTKDAQKVIGSTQIKMVKDLSTRLNKFTELSGENMLKAMSDGIKNNTEPVVEATEEVAQEVMDTLDSTIDVDEIAGKMGEVAKTISDGIASTLNPLQVSMDTGIDIFSEFGKEYELTSQQLLANMKSQNDGVRQWGIDLQILVAKGLDEGLIQKLKEAGPQSAEQIAAFMQMTTNEIEQANAEWRKSNQLTAETIINNQKEALKTAQEWAAGITQLAEMGLNKQLLQQLGEAGIGSAEYVKAYLSMTPSQIAEMNAAYETYLTIPDTIAETVINSFVETGEKSIKGFADGAVAGADDATTVITNANMEVMNSVNNSMVEYSQQSGQNVSQAMANGIVSSTEAVKAAADSVSSTVNAVFGTNLQAETAQNIGTTFGDGLIQGISSSKPKVAEEANIIAKTTAEVANEGVEEGMAIAGQNAVTTYTESVTTIGETNSPEKQEIKDTYVAVTTEVGEAAAKTAKIQGQKTIEAVVEGAKSREDLVQMTFASIARTAYIALSGFLNEEIGRSLGTSIVTGIITGFKENESYITEEARTVALKALAAAKAALGIASPSKEFIKVGEYTCEGLVIGLKRTEGLVENESETIANGLLNTIKQASKKVTFALSNDMTASPVITPVIDLSQVNKAVKTIDTTFSRNLSMKLSAEANISTNGKLDKLDVDSINGGEADVTNNYSFVQNNYSPKELSRIDIYRDTRSQFAQFRKRVEA